MYYVKQRLNYLWMSLLVVVLTACSQNPTPVANSDIVSVASIKIAADTTQLDIEAEYGAKAIVFRPEAGFAILGFSEDHNHLTALATDPNQDAFSSPEVSSAGTTAWASGKNAWGGGLKAWAGGKNAWGGGIGVSAPSENSTVWNQIKLPQAHAISRKFGQGIKVAVIDTGIDLNHPVFSGSLAPSSEWKDFVDGDAYPMDTTGGNGYGHGTAVASIILQIAPKATILPLRVLNPNGLGDTDDVVAAIDWAVQKGVSIINVSLGSQQSVDALRVIAGYANSMGIMVFASSGNYGGNETMTYPGGYSWWGGTTYRKTLGIGSITSNNQLSSFTSYGYNLYGVAPGEKIAAAYPGNQAVSVTGTSFATPLFTGAGALALSEMSGTTNKVNLTDYFWSSLDFSLSTTTGIEGARLLDVEKLIRVLPGFSEPIYQLVNVNSGKCLEVYGSSVTNGGTIDQWWCYNGNGNRWKLVYTGGFYQLRNMSSNLVANVANSSTSDGANITQWTSQVSNNQLWTFRSSGSAYEIVARHSGKCMDVSGGSGSDGAYVIQWACSGGNNQKWQLRLMN